VAEIDRVGISTTLKPDKGQKESGKSFYGHDQQTADEADKRGAR
jgi:hypothetical protein